MRSSRAHLIFGPLKDFLCPQGVAKLSSWLLSLAHDHGLLPHDSKASEESALCSWILLRCICLPPLQAAGKEGNGSAVAFGAEALPACLRLKALLDMDSSEGQSTDVEVLLHPHLGSLTPQMLSGMIPDVSSCWACHLQHAKDMSVMRLGLIILRTAQIIVKRVGMII